MPSDLFQQAVASAIAKQNQPKQSVLGQLGQLAPLFMGLSGGGAAPAATGQISAEALPDITNAVQGMQATPAATLGDSNALAAVPQTLPPQSGGIANWLKALFSGGGFPVTAT